MTPSPPGPAQPPGPARRALLVTLCAVQFIDAYDVAAMGPALPRIQRQLAMSPDALQWVVTAFVLDTAGSCFSADGLPTWPTAPKCSSGTEPPGITRTARFAQRPPRTRQISLCAGTERFSFLLGGNDGEHLLARFLAPTSSVSRHLLYHSRHRNRAATSENRRGNSGEPQRIWVDPARLPPDIVGYTAAIINAVERGTTFALNGW